MKFLHGFILCLVFNSIGLASDGEISLREVEDLLLAGKHTPTREGDIDISNENPQNALEISRTMFRYSIPSHLEEVTKVLSYLQNGSFADEIKCANDGNNITIKTILDYLNGLKVKGSDTTNLMKSVKIMGTVIAQGETPQQKELNDALSLTPDIVKKNVQLVYDILLNTFLWQNGVCLEPCSFEVANSVVVRARLTKLRNSWDS